MKVRICSLCIGVYKLLSIPIEVGDYTPKAKELIEEKCDKCGELKFCKECEISEEENIN